MTQASESPAKPALILVADDDETVRSLVRETLEIAGFRVAEARHGAEAVSAFSTVRPDMVLMDVRMPQMDGFQATAALRKLPGAESVPILILTGFDDVDSVTRAYEAGATDFASKPINLLILQHRVRYMLRASASAGDLRRSQKRLAAAQRIARLGHWERDVRSGALQWSDEIFRLFDLDPEGFEPTFERYLKRVHPDDRAFVERSIGEALAGDRPHSFDLRIALPGGGVRHVHEEAEIVRDETGAPVTVTGAMQDITERKQAEGQIRFLAYYDGLTLLPNRLLFMERLDQALSTAKRQSRPLAMLFLDLDRFKRINDTLGHTLGDRLLQGVAERLRRCLRSSDTIARVDPGQSGDDVARLGGDEFIVSIPDIARGEDAARVARRIMHALNEPFRLDAHEVVVTASIGISLYPHDADDVEALLKNADVAMYHAKEAGRGGFQFYNKSMNAAAYQRLSLENSLRKALEREEFLLYYQPLVDADGGAVIGAEALIRWRHPELGLVSPADFIPLAEETGLIVPMGEWVLRRASAQIQAWRDAGHRDLVISVNLSARQFRAQGLESAIDDAVRSARLDARALDLEITESVLMKGAEETTATLERLKRMGVRISVDDFGTGYSSLSYLTRFPIDTLKIDQSFVRGIPADAGDAAITTAIIAMAKSLGLMVIAEGVETEEQRAFLQARGCRYMQGYLFSRPVPAEEFAALLERWKGGRAAAAG